MSERSPRLPEIPRLLSPRLSIGRRWATFCRSQFAAHLRAAARGTFGTLVAVSAAVTFFVGINAAAALYTAVGGVA